MLRSDLFFTAGNYHLFYYCVIYTNDVLNNLRSRVVDSEAIPLQINKSTRNLVWLMPYLIVFSTSLALAAGNIYMPSLPQMSHYFECTSNRLLISVSIFYTGFAASGIAYGALADYFGRRLTLLYGFGIFLLGSCMCLIATKLWVYMLGSMLEGIGGASALIVGLASIQDIYTAEESAKTLGWTGALLAIIPSISPIIGGYLSPFGWRMSYVLINTLGFFIYLLLYVYFIETKTKLYNETHNSSICKQFILSYYTVIKHTGFLRYASIYPILVMGSTALLTAMPIYIMVKLGFDAKSCGYYIGFMTIGYAFGGFLASKLVKKIGIKPTLKIGLFLSLLSSIILVICQIFDRDQLTFLAPVFFLQSGMAIVHPPSTTTAVRYFSSLRACASAIRGTFSVLGSALGAMIAAHLAGLPIIYLSFFTIITSLAALSLS